MLSMETWKDLTYNDGFLIYFTLNRIALYGTFTYLFTWLTEMYSTSASQPPQCKGVSIFIALYLQTGNSKSFTYMQEFSQIKTT